MFAATHALALEVETIQAAKSVGANGSDLAVTTTDLDPHMYRNPSEYQRFGGEVIQLHESNTSGSYKGWIHYGGWNTLGNLQWASKDIDTGFRVQHVSIDINNHGCIFEIDSKGSGSRLRLDTRFKPHNRNNTNVGYWTSGRYLQPNDNKWGIRHGASTSINDDGVVVIVYKRTSNGQLYYGLGQMNANCSAVEWHQTNKEYDSGAYPGISISNEQNGVSRLIEVHQGSEGLYYNTGYIVRDEVGRLSIAWTETREVGGKTLAYGKKYDYDTNKSGIRPSVSLSSDGTHIVAINRYKAGGDNFDLQGRADRLDIDENGKLFLVDELREFWRMKKTDGSNATSGKVPSVTITNEGYATLMHISGSTINYSTYLIGQKLIKSEHWENYTITIEELEGNPLIPNKLYRFGFIPQDDGFSIIDGDENILLEDISTDNKHQTFYAQADTKGKIQLTLKPNQQNSSSVDGLIGIMTMNEASAEVVVENSTETHYKNKLTFDNNGEDYTYTFHGLAPGTLYSLGFHAENNCFHLVHEGREIYGVDSLHGIDEYYLADVASNTDGEINLTLTVAECNNKNINEFISNIEIFKVPLNTLVIPMEDYPEGHSWTYNPENHYFTTKVGGLMPERTYALTSFIPNTCAAIMNNDQEIMLNQEKHIANIVSNEHGELDLILKIEDDPELGCDLPLNILIREINIYTQYAATKIRNHTEDWQSNEASNIWSADLPHIGKYHITGVKRNLDASISSGSQQPLFKKQMDIPDNNFSENVTLDENSTVTLRLNDDSAFENIEEIVSDINVVLEIPNIQQVDSPTKESDQCMLVDSNGESTFETCDF